MLRQVAVDRRRRGRRLGIGVRRVDVAERVDSGLPCRVGLVGRVRREVRAAQAEVHVLPSALTLNDAVSQPALFLNVVKLVMTLVELLVSLVV